MPSLIKKANMQLRAGKYEKAVYLYKCALLDLPELSEVIRFNLNFAQTRLIKSASCKKIAQSQNESYLNWVSHIELQENVDLTRAAFGSVVIGYPDQESNKLPSIIAEVSSIFTQVGQITNSHGLRLIDGNKSNRLLPTTFGSSVILHEFSSERVRISSCWYANSRDLRLIVSNELPLNTVRVFRAYQYDPVVDGGLVLVGESVLNGKACQMTELGLANPLLPVLLTLADSAGVLTDATLIPYPSLLPGGAHEHECYATADEGVIDPMHYARELLSEHLRALKYGWALGQVQIDIREAIGSEPILSTDFKEWLWSVFSVRIQPWRPPEIEHSLAEYWKDVFRTPSLMGSAERFVSQTKRERLGRTLLCPPRAIPSLRALTASCATGSLVQTCGISNFLLVKERPVIERWRLSWPALALSPEGMLKQDGAIRIPMVVANKEDAVDKAQNYNKGIAAILVCHTFPVNHMQLIMPVAPDCVETELKPCPKYSVDVVITAAEFSEKSFAALLETLLLQSITYIRSIVVVMPSKEDEEVFEALLSEKFASRYVLLQNKKCEHYKQRVQRATAAIKGQPDDSCMLFINRPLVFHDSRTLKKLVQALSTPKTVTTCAPLIGNVERKSKRETTMLTGGVFPVKRYEKKAFELCETNLSANLPMTSLPVASPGTAFFMIKSKDWKKSGGFAEIKAEDECAIHEYSAKLSAADRIHMLVPHVTVKMYGVSSNPHSIEIIGGAIGHSYSHSNAVLIKTLSK